MISFCMYLLSMAIIFSSNQCLYAILDGRVAPIYLENRYTFTNFEWAKGLVYFKQGFDLPAHGTVFIDVTHQVDKSINLKNGTLVLDNDLYLGAEATISGSGYINAQGKRLFLITDWQPAPSEQFFFTSNIIFQGIGINSLNLVASGPSGGIFFGNNVLVTFLNFNLGPIGWGAFKTQSNAPSGIVFKNSTIFLLYESLTLASLSINMSGNVNVVGANKFTFKCNNPIVLNQLATLSISPNTIFQTSMIQSSFASGTIILDNAKMVYTPQTYIFSPTSTSRIFFTKTFPGGNHSGTLIVKGSSELEIPVGTSIYFSDQSILQLESGANLSLNPGSRLKIY